MSINPYAPDVRYTLAYMAFQVSRYQPRSVRIATLVPEVAVAMARYFDFQALPLVVESEAIQQALHLQLGRSAAVRDQAPAHVAVFPLSFDIRDTLLTPQGEPCIVVACYNNWSYKRLITPRLPYPSARTTFHHLSAMYQIEPLAGVFSPRFILLWALSRWTERWKLSWYFRLEEHAMRYIIETNRQWRISHIAIARGTQR